MLGVGSQQAEGTTSLRGRGGLGGTTGATTAGCRFWYKSCAGAEQEGTAAASSPSTVM